MLKLEIRIDPNFSGKCSSEKMYFAKNKFEFIKIFEKIRMQMDSGESGNYLIIVKSGDHIPEYVYKIVEYLRRVYGRIIEITDNRLSKFGFDGIIDLISFNEHEIQTLKKMKNSFPGKLSREATIDLILSLFGLTSDPSITEAVNFLIMWHHRGVKERLSIIKEEVAYRLRKAIKDDIYKLLSKQQSLNSLLINLDETILSQLVRDNPEIVHPVILKRYFDNKLNVDKIDRDIIQRDCVLKVILELQTISSKEFKPKEYTDFVELHFKISQLEKMVYFLPEYIKRYQKRLIKRLKDIKREVNRLFAKFIEQNYKKWIQSKPRPIMPMDILDKLLEKLESGNKILFVVFDGMSILEWLILEDELTERRLKINRNVCLSLIPSVTVFSRNSIFFNIPPDEISKRFYNNGPITDNKKEGLVFKSYFISHGFKAEFANVGDILKEEEKIFELMSKGYDVIGVVVRHIDAIIDAAGKGTFDRKFLARSFSTYAKDVASFIKESVEKGYSVIVTADHGNTEIDESIVIDTKDASGKDYFAHSRYFIADRKLKDNIERSLGGRATIVIRDPTSWKLPEYYKNKFIYVAVDPFKFTLRQEKEVISHGGATMDELIVPFMEVKC